MVAVPQRDLWDSHPHPDRDQVRLQVIKLSYQGWDKVSIRPLLRWSRPTVDRWLTRFEAEHFAGLMDHKRGPKAPRQRWLPVMVEVDQRPTRHPDAGECRIGSLLARPDLSARTIGRMMAINRQVYEDIPPVRKPGPPPPPPPHPYKACRPHESGFIEGRMMDCALEGGTWWSLIMVDGYSRTLLAGAVAPVEASWVALMVLYTACLR